MKKLLFACCLTMLCGAVRAQKVPPLERIVSLRVSEEAVSAVLSRISTQTGIRFSYNPTSVPVARKVSLTVNRKPVRTVLKMLFGEGVTCRQRGDFVIITPRPAAFVREQVKHITISGYVYDSRGEKLASASVLSRQEHVSAVTDEYGFYRLQVPANHFPVRLKVEKQNYIDTTVVIGPGETGIDLVLVQARAAMAPVPVAKPSQAAAEPPADTSSTIATASAEPFPGEVFLPKKARINMRNLKDTLFSHVQFSVIPRFSTNSLLAGNTVNDVSVNVIAGYSQGVKKAEIGGLLNIDRGDVRSVQVAGGANAVSGKVEGVQVAGIANLNAGRGEGVRVAGVLNAGHHMKGVQAAGVANINANYVSAMQRMRNIVNDTVTGFQAAGVINVNAGYAEGIRLAGVYNAGNCMKGFQGAGTLNVNTGFMYGTQISGTANITLGDARGFQLAGATNVSAKRMDGVQLAAVFNFARNLHGTQIGLVNYTDSCDGMMLGIFSYSRRGYRKLEVAGDEVFPLQVAFRTGVPKFHNILLAGIDPFTFDNPVWSVGYGIGSSFRLSEHWNFTADLITQMVMKSDSVSEKYSPQLNSLFAGVEWQIGKKFSVAAGPAFRMMITYPVSKEYSAHGEQRVPYVLDDVTLDKGPRVQTWIGGKLSLRFL